MKKWSQEHTNQYGTDGGLPFFIYIYILKNVWALWLWNASTSYLMSSAKQSDV